MKQETVFVQVHRWWDNVAVYVGGKTVYLTPDQALELARALSCHAHDIDKTTYGKGTVPTFGRSFEPREVTEPIERITE